MKITALLFMLCLCLVGCSSANSSIDCSACSDNKANWLAVDDISMCPAKFTITDYQQGQEGQYCLSIQTGDYPTSFSIFYFPPRYTAEGYTAIIGAEKWITISEPNANLTPHETKIVTVTIKVPKDVELPPKWEFWIKVAQQGNGKLVELNSRWFITTQ